MALLSMAVGVVLAVMILGTIPKVKGAPLKGAVAGAALLVLIGGVVLGSVRFVPASKVGVVIKNAMSAKLPAGQIIATSGEMGPQARILPPGWHFGYWPVIYDIDLFPVQEIPQGQVGLLIAQDGRPLPPGQIYAPEWGEAEFQSMLTAEHFLGEGGGFKGPQASVLTPGKYRINPRLFQIEILPVTNIPQATVGVVKSNVGALASQDGAATRVVEVGDRGIWRVPFEPQQLYLHSKAYEVTRISTELRTVRYTKGARSSADGGDEQREITVRSSDGFTFPVDVRIEYQITPADAPLVVANFTNDGGKLKDRLNSVVRSVFRNNAESVKALDYVRQRSQQESQSLTAIRSQMGEFGVTVTAVRIGDVGDAETLGDLLKTQTDREIALQQQLTFQEQQRAAEQRKALTRTQQEAEEEKRLATATYEVQIAEEQKQQRIIGASAEAESIRIRAEAQAQAFREIASQIGSGNAALLEMLKVIGADGIQITPRVMVTGGGGADAGQATPASAETVALIGTMLDSMIERERSGDNDGAAPRASAREPEAAGAPNTP